MIAPEKLILIGGLPRAGKSMLRNIIGSHRDITVPPSEFQFFSTFSQKDYDQRGGFQENLEYFFTHGRKSQAWQLSREMVSLTGTSRADLHYILLESYRANYYPDKKYVVDNSPFLEQHFGQLAIWYGLENLRFLHVYRSPFDVFASMKKRNKTKYYDKRAQVQRFARAWSHSMIIGMHHASLYPQAYRMIDYERLVSNPRPFITELCAWLGVAPDVDSMLAMQDYQKKHNSSFDLGGLKISGDLVQKVEVDRKKYLSPYEIAVIERMSIINLLTPTTPEAEPLGFGLKKNHRGRDLDQKNLLFDSALALEAHLVDLSLRNIVRSWIKNCALTLAVLLRRLKYKLLNLGFSS